MVDLAGGSVLLRGGGLLSFHSQCALSLFPVCVSGDQLSAAAPATCLLP